MVPSGFAQPWVEEPSCHGRARALQGMAGRSGGVWRLGTETRAVAEKTPRQRGAHPPSSIPEPGLVTLVFLFFIKKR